MLKFLLLERGRVALAGLPALMAAVPLAAHAGRSWLGMEADELARWAAEALVRAGAACYEDGWLADAV